MQVSTSPRDNPRVFLVGAGPGDAKLVTRRAVERLGQADVVLYDYLVNPTILDHAPAHAERVCLGHHSTGRAMSQEAINARMVAEAQRGRTVVRLKGGDPAVFARTADEVTALRNAEIAYEIVPGITTALALPAYAGIPLANATSCGAIGLVTGRQRDDKHDDLLDYNALTTFPGTLVVYMGVRAACRWSQELIANGRSHATAVAIVRRCSWPDQKIVRCTLGTLAETVAAKNLRAPAIIVVGEAASTTCDLK